MSDAPAPTVTAVHPTAHARTRVRTDLGFVHAASLGFCPVTVRELDHACANYPVVFLKDAQTGRFRCVALLGFAADENLFATVRDGRASWNATYAPETVRRYPFSLGIQGDAPDATPTVLCIADDPAVVNDTTGERLFDDQGGETPYLAAMKRMLAGLIDGERDTTARIDALVAHRLLREIAIALTHRSGKTHRLEGVYSTDREALAALDDGDVAALHRSGALALAQASAASLAQVTRLVQLKNLRTDDPIVGVRAETPQSAL